MKITTILVVEDYEPFRRFVCSSLQQEFQVFQALDGLHAIQQAEDLQPDLILLDIGLPKLNGIEVAIRLRELAPHAKILFLSQHSDPDLIRHTLHLRAHGYLQKPRAQSDLLPAIETVLGGRRFVSSVPWYDEEVDIYGRHKVQFCSDDAVFLEGVSRFIGSALKAHNPAIVMATKSHREGLVQKLNGAGVDVDSAIQNGTFILLDAAEMLSKVCANGIPDLVRFSEGLSGLIETATKMARTERPRAGIFSECVGLLYAERNLNAALSLERAGNEMLKRYDMNILCSYPSLHWLLDKESFRSITTEHTTIYSAA
jgi:CheY-like chemotaxis protein